MNPTSKVCMILFMPHHKSQPCAYLNTLEPILYTEVAGHIVLASAPSPSTSLSPGSRVTHSKKCGGKGCKG